MTVIHFPQFSRNEVTPYDMRQLVQALELRFQSLESGQTFDLFDTDTDDLDNRYAQISHTHLAADITDLTVVSSIFDLTDVSGTPDVGYTLTWTGSEFAATAPGSISLSLNDLNNVAVPAPSDMEVLTWDQGSGQWVAAPVSVSGGGVDNLVDLLDTDLAGQTIGDLLFNADGSEWRPSGTNFQWLPGDMRLQLGNAHSINWYNAAFSSTELLNFLSVTGSLPYAPDIAVYLSLDGANGATTYTDDDGNAWNFQGTNAQLSSAFVKFGSTSFTVGPEVANASYLHNGTVGMASSGNIDLANFGTGDFTIEFWFYIDPTDASFAGFVGGNNFVAQLPLGVVSGNYSWRVSINNNVLSFNYCTTAQSGGENNFRSLGGGLSTASGAWTHIVVERFSGTIRGFVNGALNGSVVDSSNIFSGGVGMIRILDSGNYGDANDHPYIDDVRITIGTAVYGGSAFTPPDAPGSPSTSAETFVVGDPVYPTLIDGLDVTIDAPTSLTSTLDVAGDTLISGGINVLSGEFTAISSPTTSDFTINSLDGFARLYILADTDTGQLDTAAVPAIVLENDGAAAQRLVMGKNQSSSLDAVGNTFNSIASAWGFHLTGSGYSFAFGVNGNADWIINQSYVQHFAGTTQNVTYTFVGGDYQVAPSTSPDYWHYMSGWDSVRFDQPLLVQERAAAITDVAGYGQLWILNNTPNELWFTDDTGVDYKVAPFVTPIDDGTVNDSVTRWDSGSTQWVEETQVRVSSAGELTILDAGLTDSAAHSHDGTDFNTDFANTTDWDIAGLSGAVNLIDVGLRINASTDSLLVSGDGADFNFLAGGSVSAVNWSGFQYFDLENGFLRILEQASPPVTGAGYGMYWVLSGASNTPVYQDDNGLDYELNTTDSSFNFTYLFESTVTTPAVSQVTLNNANQTLATEVRVHAQCINRQRISNQVFLSNATVFPIGTIITLQMAYDVQDRFRVYRTTGNPVNNGSYVTFPVTYLTGSAALTDGVRMRLNLQRPAGATINQGTTDTAMLRWDSATASWVESSRLRLSSGGVLGLYDGTGADSMTIENNGTNVDFNFTGVSNVQWLGISNNILLRSTGGITGQGILSNTGFTFTYAEELLNMQILNTPTNFDIAGLATGTGIMWLRDGARFRVSDTADTDWGESRHDGTDFHWNFTNTAELNINDVPVHLTEGSLFMTEKAAADADTAGRGQLWVKNDAPNTLWFTDDDGTDYQLALPVPTPTPYDSDRWNFNTSISFANPGAGQFGFNSATPASVTNLYINDIGASGQDVATLIAGSGLGTIFYIFDPSDPTSTLVYRRTGAATNNTDWYSIIVTHVSGTQLPSSGEEMVIQFAQPIVPRGTVEDTVLIWNNSTYLWEQTGTDLTINSSVAAVTEITTGDSILELDSASQVRIGTGAGTFYGQYTNNNSFIALTTSGGLKRIATGSSGGDLTMDAGNGTASIRLDTGSTLKLSERAAALSDTAAFGQLWVRNDTPNTLWFTDDTGVDYQLNNVGASAQTITATWTTGSGGTQSFASGATFSVESGAVMRLQEQAAGPTAAAGYGYPWVKNDAPSTFWFRDDTGVDYEVIPQAKFKSADTSRNTTATVADDPHIAGFNLLADTYYSVEGVLVVNSASATPDFDFVFQFSNTEQLSRMSAHAIDAALNETLYAGDMVTEVTIPITATDKNIIYIRGFFRSNAMTGGTLDLQWAQNTSDMTDVTLEAGSWVRVSSRMI